MKIKMEDPIMQTHKWERMLLEGCNYLDWHCTICGITVLQTNKLGGLEFTADQLLYVRGVLYGKTWGGDPDPILTCDEELIRNIIE
jgi:hypothetical protein